MAIERIAVATTARETATRAVAWAAEMARNYGAQLIVVQAFVPGPPPADAETDLAAYAEEMGGPGSKAACRRRGPGATRSSPPPTRRTPTSSSSATRDERPPRVPARQRPEPRLAQRALYGRDREHRRGAEEAAPVERGRDRARRRAPDRARGRGSRRSSPSTASATGREKGANRAARLREALEELGPTFAKLGQILSTRPDLIPPDVVEELAAPAGRRAAADRGGGRRR